jgi:hypothetical protein
LNEGLPPFGGIRSLHINCRKRRKKWRDFPVGCAFTGKTPFTPMQNPNIPSSRLLFSKAGAPPRLCRRLLPVALLSLLVSLALSPAARAVSPPPDGGYPNDNTAEGTGALGFLTTGSANTAVGSSALQNITTANQNTAIGAFALIGPNNASGSDNTATGFSALSANTASRNTADGSGALQSNTTGNTNTATGNVALFTNSSGSFNTATGAFALELNTTGDQNTATGYAALLGNKTGADNTANGVAALLRNSTGNDNTASGYEALVNNTTGSDNTANGSLALSSNTTGANNTANGAFALAGNSTGGGNTATGWSALQANSNGGFNAAYGNYALYSNTTGYSNVADGVDALYYNKVGHDNTAEGYGALLHNTGSNNTALGSGAGFNLTTGTNNIDIGAAGVAGDSGKIRIGKQGTQNATFIAGIFGVTMTGSPVVVNSSGKLGVSGASSARFKEAIKPMDKDSEAILALKPVTFRYKQEIDPDKIPQFGLIAEQVDKVDPNLVVRDENGEVTSVRYDAVNAMFLNEFLKEHRTVQQQTSKLKKQDGTISRLKALIREQEKLAVQQQKQIEGLTIGLRKVSDRVELINSSPRLVAENH